MVCYLLVHLFGYVTQEEEEEEEGDEDVQKPVHPYVSQVQGLLNEVHSTLHLLVAHPLPESEIYDIAFGIVGDMLESVVEHHEKALEVCELAQMVQTNGVVLPALPSPFASEEGAAAWAHALAQTSHIAEPEGGGKKAPAKPAKGAAPTEPTKQQIDFFYKTLYEGVRGDFLNAGVATFAKVDETIQKVATAPLTKYGTSMSALFNVAAPRLEDCASEGEAASKVAFVALSGGAFSQQSSVHSAFDVKQANKLRAIAPILQIIEYGAKAVVMVCESDSTVSCPQEDALLPHFDEIKTLISQERADFITKTNKTLRKLKQKPPVYKELVFSKYASFAEFYYHAESIFRQDASSGSSKNSYFNLNVPVILIENVLVPGVVPPEPPLEEIMSDDDEAPVLLGLEESQAKRRKDWEARRPHRVPVTLDLTKLSAGAPKRGGSGSKQQPPTVRVDCFAHAPSAVVEAFQLVSSATSSAPVWVDANLYKLYDSSSLLPTLDRSVVTQRLVSEEVREACLWAGILQLMPQAETFLRHVPVSAAAPNEASADAESDGVTTVAAPTAPSSKDLVAAHFARLFPYSAETKTAPVCTVVLGGSIRAEKFAVLDQLIDLVRVNSVTCTIAMNFIFPYL